MSRPRTASCVGREERAQDLVDLLTPPSRDLLLREKPRSAIARAVLVKYPELQRKVGKAAAVSSKAIAKQRSLFQKNALSPIVDASQVEIHVATPPEKTRIARRDAPSESDANVSEQLAAASSRRLFQDESDSVMPLPRVAEEQQAEASAAVASTAVSAPDNAVSSAPVPPAAPRYDDTFRRSHAELSSEDTKIPLPSTRSPMPRSHTSIPRVFGGTSRSQDSPTLSNESPSRIPRRVGSVTSMTTGALKVPSPLQRRGSSSTAPTASLKAPSTSPLRRAGSVTSVPISSFKLPSSSPLRRATTTSVGASLGSSDAASERTEHALDAPDRFLDSPIPSSGPSPTPLRADSNVTVRARRKVIARAIDNAFLTASAAAPRESVSAPAHDEHAAVGSALSRSDVVAALVVTSSHSAACVQDAEVAVSEPLPALPPSPLQPHTLASVTEDSLLLSPAAAAVADEPLLRTTALESAVADPEPLFETTERSDVNDSAGSFQDAVGLDASDESNVEPSNDDDADTPSSVEPQYTEVVDAMVLAAAAATPVPDDDDLDIDETMLISRDAAARDFVDAAADERTCRDDAEPDSLTRNALENLIGIQRTMITLQALTKVDARGIPLKHRAERPARLPVARPHSAGRTRSDVPAASPRPLATEYDIASERADSPGAYLTRPRAYDSDAAHAHMQDERPVDTRSAEARHEDSDKRRRNAFVRGTRPPSDRRSVALPPAADFVEHRQPAVSVTARRRPSADAAREDVERQFETLVRASVASQARPTSACSDELTRRARVTLSAPPVQHDVSSTTASLEPPIPLTVKPADAVMRRARLSAHPGPNARRPHDVASARPQAQRRAPDAPRQSWLSSYIGYFLLLLGFVFGASGLLRAATTVRDTHDYHEALKARIGLFEASIAESYAAVRKLEENYGVWREYVRLLADEDETHALSLLETIQREVEQWQVDMQHDLAQFKQALAIDIVDAAIVPLLQNASAAAINHTE